MQEYLASVFNVLVKRTGDNQVTAVLVSRSSYFDYFHNDCCSLPVLRKKHKYSLLTI